MHYTQQQLHQLRSQWRYTGRQRPPFAATPSNGQESAWDYPRPPRVELSPKRIQVLFADRTIADSTSTLRVLETSSPPVYYIPPADVNRELLIPSKSASLCEWKGVAAYHSLKDGTRILEDVAWHYPSPFSGYRILKNFIAFYPAKLTCLVNGIQAQPQKDPFYGGWITPEVVGPFKDEAPES